MTHASKTCRARKSIRLDIPWNFGFIVLMKSLVFGVCIFLVCGAKGVMMVNDSFDYLNRPLAMVSAGPCSSHSGITGQGDVVSGRVDLRVPETEASPAYISSGFVRDGDVPILSICSSHASINTTSRENEAAHSEVLKWQ